MGHVRRLIFLALCLIGCDIHNKQIRSSRDPSCIGRVIKNEFVIQFNDDRGRRKIRANPNQVRALALDSKVDWIEPNYVIPSRRSDLVFQSSYVRSNPYTIRADYAWARGSYGQSVNVAVVDSGVDTTHTQLIAAFKRNGSTRVFGADEFGWNFKSDSPEILDEIGHGTHIAGIIAAAPNSKFSGIAPGVGLIAADFMDARSGDEYLAERSLTYAIRRGANIINNSWSNYCSQSLKAAFASWRDQNIIFVNAAGNDDLQIDRISIYPSSLSYDNMITVGSIDSRGRRSRFSNYGSIVTTFAPGEDIFSLYPYAQNDFLVTRSGTSIANAFVTGGLALAWSAFPEMTASQVVGALKTISRTQSNHQPWKMDVRELFQELNRQRDDQLTY